MQFSHFNFLFYVRFIFIFIFICVNLLLLLLLAACVLWIIEIFVIFFCLFLTHFSVVVAQAYKVDVEVLAASRGCSAILRCVIPTFVKELVRVVSWVQEPAFYIYPSLQGGNVLTFKWKLVFFFTKIILTISNRNVLSGIKLDICRKKQ